MVTLNETWCLCSLSFSVSPFCALITRRHTCFATLTTNSHLPGTATVLQLQRMSVTAIIDTFRKSFW